MLMAKETNSKFVINLPSPLKKIISNLKVGYN